MSFAQLGLSEPLLRALSTVGHDTPTPIQVAAIPSALAGRDILACAQTGTGKTAAFTLPILQRLAAGRRGAIRALILAPTRELADQVCEQIESYGRNLPLRAGSVIGGMSMGPQLAMLKRGVDVLVATPGRLLDHMERGSVRLDGIEVVVLDEADRMLDMGFIRDIRRVMQAVPAKRQTMFFSATLPDPILKLAKTFQTEPQRVEVSKRSSAPTSVQQIVHPVADQDKRPVLLELLKSPQMSQVIVFTRTKWGANKLTRHLVDHGHRAAAIHGNKTQAQRRAALEGFRDGRLRVLVATDIASRGIDVTGVSHVINYEIPNVPEDYVHRIGRTGRGSASGVAISLMSHAERSYIRAIEQLTGVAIPRLAASVGSSSAPVHARPQAAQTQAAPQPAERAVDEAPPRRAPRPARATPMRGGARRRWHA